MAILGPTGLRGFPKGSLPNLAIIPYPRGVPQGFLPEVNSMAAHARSCRFLSPCPAAKNIDFPLRFMFVLRVAFEGFRGGD